MVWMTGRPGTTAGYDYDVVFPENNVHNSHHSHHTHSLSLFSLPVRSFFVSSPPDLYSLLLYFT